MKKHRIEFVNKTKGLIKPERVTKSKDIKPKEIWIVGGGDGFGIKTPICSFTNGRDAELFIIDCYGYNKKRPKESASLKIKRKWEKGHPAGEKGIWSNYYLYFVPLLKKLG